MALEDEAVQRFRHELRAKSQAIMVGSNTVRIDNPKLTVRGVAGRSPLRVVPASRADIPPDSHVLTDGHATLVAVSLAARPKQVQSLRRNSAVESVSLGDDRVDLTALLAYLSQRGISQLMVEGGATLLASLFRARLVDQLIVQHLPVIFGGAGLPSMVGGPQIARLDEAIPLQLADLRQIGKHAVMTYRL